jgi:hypothetical protein
MREMSTLIQAVNPMMFLGGPVAAAWMLRLAQNIELMIKLERLKTTGELRGWVGIKRQLTPSVLRQLGVGVSEKPKKRKFQKAKFKREKDK